MKEFGVEDIIKSVRVALDENKVSEALIAEADIDTLTLNEIIKSKIEDAARTISLMAPNHLLAGGDPFGDAITWQSSVGYGAGSIVLPEDFLRLVCFQMSDWSYAVTDAISADHPYYKMQFSRHAGIKGNPQKPVVAIVTQTVGRVLQFFSCTAGDSIYIKQASYIPMPSITEVDGYETIRFCELLHPSIVYYAAHLVALSLKDMDAATTMLNLSKEFLQ